MQTANVIFETRDNLRVTKQRQRNQKRLFHKGKVVFVFIMV